jgi:hypothetical protein
MQNLELQVRGQEWRTQSETEATLLDEFQAKICRVFMGGSTSWGITSNFRS